MRRSLEQLEDSQTESADATSRITERMTGLKTEAAALEAERSTALAHIDDLKSLRVAMEGDREKKQLLIDSFLANISRLEEEIRLLRQRQQENDTETAQRQQELQQVITSRAETECVAELMKLYILFSHRN